MSETPLVVERRPDRVVARLNRPDKRNAIDREMIGALHELCEELEAEPRTLILTGTDAVFAAGADIGQLRARRAEDARRGINATAFIRIHELPMPVIAALDGYALGGGAEDRQPRANPRDHRCGRCDVCRVASGSLAAIRSAILLTGHLLTADEALTAGLSSLMPPTSASPRRH